MAVAVEGNVAAGVAGNGQHLKVEAGQFYPVAIADPPAIQLNPFIFWCEHWQLWPVPAQFGNAAGVVVVVMGEQDGRWLHALCCCAEHRLGLSGVDEYSGPIGRLQRPDVIVLKCGQGGQSHRIETMPAAPFPRQAAVSAWFEKEGADAMRAVEHPHLLEQLRASPSQPWLWLAPCAAWCPEPAPAGRGLRLHRQAAGWGGDVCCTLPLPLPSEAVNAIVLQHPVAAELDPLLAECARVLMPGGRLWLTLLNHHSPYRSHWQWRGMRPPTAMRCRASLQREGLRIRATQHVGPVWSETAGAAGKTLPALRAVCVLECEKRTSAFIGPEKVQPVGWRGPVAT